MLKYLQTEHGWKESLTALLKPHMFHMLLLGFSAGLPLLLIFSSLSLWLGEAGIEKSAVTYFSWAALGYSFKFVWAPLVDCLPIPFLTRTLGLRRSWLLVAQAAIAGAIYLMASTDPAVESQLVWMAVGAVLLGFSAATQDISIDAYRIEAVSADMQALMSSAYMAGYRVGMIVAGAGVLYLASYLGSTKEHYVFEAWKGAYLAMAGCMIIGVIATLLIKEPIKRESKFNHSAQEYLGLLMAFLLCVTGFIFTFYLTSSPSVEIKKSLADFFGNKALAGFIVEVLRLVLGLFFAFSIGKACAASRLVSGEMLINSYVSPVKQFFEDYGLKTAWLLLALVGLYRISDIVLGVMSNIFYQDMGFTKIEIANAVKFFGLAMTIFGGFVGGILAMRFGVMRILFLGALLVVVTNLLFILLLFSGPDLHILYGVVAADNLVAGLASAAFIAFLSSLVNIEFTAMQYAILSSLMTLIPKILAGYSGSIVDSIGYMGFFIFAATIGLPILILIVLANRSLKITGASKADG